MTLARTDNGRGLPAAFPDGDAPADLRGSALEAITRAEIDVQVATAKRFPRSMSKFIAEAKSMVAVDPDLAAQCTYWLPARQGSTEPLTGPSVRLAEIVAVCWGNLRVVGRIADDDGKFLTAQGVAIDLERNVGYSVEVKRGITTKEGRRFGADMIKVTGNAAVSIATRNATFKVVPRAFVNLIEDEARQVAKGDIKTLPTRVFGALDWFATKGITEDRVFALLGVGGAADITLDLLGRLNGLRTAVRDGQARIDEIFAPPQQQQAAGTPAPGGRAAELAGRINAGRKPAPAPVTPPPAEDVPQEAPAQEEESQEVEDGDVEMPEGF